MTSDDDYGSDDATSGKDRAVAVKVVRFVLSIAESQNTIISRARLQNAIREACRMENHSRIVFSKVFEQVNDLLADVFGYALIGLPPRNKAYAIETPTQASHQEQAGTQEVIEGSRAQHFILLNKLEKIKSIEAMKIAESTHLYEEVIIDGEYLNDGDAKGSIDNTTENTLSSDTELAFKGLLSVTLCAIIFSKNNILHSELLRYLESFGVPIDGTEIPILQYPLDEFLKTLDKREYIARIQEKSDTEGSDTTYRVGRRTHAEFTLDSLLQLVEEIMGVDGSQFEEFKLHIEKSIGDSYTS